MHTHTAIFQYFALAFFPLPAPSPNLDRSCLYSWHLEFNVTPLLPQPQHKQPVNVDRQGGRLLGLTTHMQSAIRTEVSMYL